MTRFNSTHFTYGSPGQFKNFVPSKMFNSAKISFSPSVITHVPLLSLELCPNILEEYRKGQKLQNFEAKERSQIVDMISS